MVVPGSGRWVPVGVWVVDADGRILQRLRVPTLLFVNKVDRTGADLENVVAAISRQDIEGQPPGGWIPSERLTFEQALKAFTRDAAYAGFSDTTPAVTAPPRAVNLRSEDRAAGGRGVRGRPAARRRVLDSE